jgi:hypothetical protein
MGIFNYKGKEIELSYSERYVENRKHPVKTKGFSRGFEKDYLVIESKAQFHLIKNAVDRRPNQNLEKIIGIQGIIKQIIFKDQPGVKIHLKGIAVYRNKDFQK